MRFIRGTTCPGLNRDLPEADFSGGYGFEVLPVPFNEWPSGRFVGGAADVNQIFVGVSWGGCVRWSGTRPRLGRNGYTRDKYGTPLGNCRVRFFRTSTGEQVYSATSDPTGWYEVLTPYYEEHFIVCHSLNFPKVQGVTEDNLFPT